MAFLILTTVAEDSHKVGVNTDHIVRFERAPNYPVEDYRSAAKVTLILRDGTRIDVKETVAVITQALGAVVP